VDYYLNKGVDIDRSKNWFNVDYVVKADLEEDGLRHYLHQYFSSEFSDSYAFMLDKEGKLIRKLDQINEFRGQMYQNELKLVLKIIVQVEDSYRLQVYNKNNEALIKYGSEYTGVHTFVFENLIEEGMRSSVAYLPFMNWISSYRARREKWKLVDIDNYLNGNDYFSGCVSQTEFKKYFLHAREEEYKVPEELLKSFKEELGKEYLYALQRIQKQYPKLVDKNIINPEEEGSGKETETVKKVEKAEKEEERKQKKKASVKLLKKKLQ